MKSVYFPKHNQNRMKNEGNVAAAREYFLTGKNRILYKLIEQRFGWMNKYIKKSDKNIIELGCGAGLSKFFIQNKELVLTDVINNEWVDKYQDALNLDVEDESLDVIICSHMIHHIAQPSVFLENAGKKLKQGGADYNTGYLHRYVDEACSENNAA